MAESKELKEDQVTYGEVTVDLKVPVVLEPMKPVAPVTRTRMPCSIAHPLPASPW